MTNPYAKQEANSRNLDQMVSSHMNLVHKIAWHMHGRVRAVMEVDDLIQIGMMGLVEAAQKFTDTGEASFASYASIRIRGAILDHLRRHSNFCRTTIKRRKLVNEAISQCTQEGLEPNAVVLAGKLEISVEEYYDWEQSFEANNAQSIDDAYSDHSIWFVSDEKAPDDSLSRKQLSARLVEVLKELPEREAILLQLYYVEELNMHEIAEVLDVSIGRVSQIKKSAIEKIRGLLKDDL